VRKKHARHPPPHGGRRTDQRKGTRLIFLGQDMGCGNVHVKRAVLRGNANEPGDGVGGPREGSLSCLTVSRKGTASAWPRPHGFKHAVRRCTVQAVRCRAAARKHSTMTLETERPERGSDDRHHAPASGASGALPPSLENVLPGKTLYISILCRYARKHILTQLCIIT